MNLRSFKSELSGFSVVELLVVLSTFTLAVLAVAIPSYHQSLARNLKESAEDLRAMIAQYQDSSSLLEHDITVSFSLPNNTIEFIEPALLPGNAPRHVPMRLPTGITLSAATFGNLSSPTELVLRSNLSATPGHFTLTDSVSHTCSVVVTIRGALRVDCL